VVASGEKYCNNVRLLALDNQIAVTDKLLRSFSVRAAVKHFVHQTELIIYEVIDIK
jgi:hypothetical protein